MGKTAELPKPARNPVILPSHSAHQLFHRIAGANVTDTKQRNVEQMSLAELLYFALFSEAKVAL